MPPTNRESQAPQDPTKYCATGMLTFSKTLQQQKEVSKSTLALKVQTLAQFLLRKKEEIGK